MSSRRNAGQLLLRMALGIGFILPVLDRFGYLGAPGSNSVAWGSWAVFVRYTNPLLPFLNETLAMVMAILATIAEIVFGVCLIIGYRIQLVAVGAALLTLTFGLCMAFFTGASAPFKYPVFVFTGGALLLSTLPAYRWSLDQLFRTKEG